MPSERDLDLIRASAAGDAERMRALLGRGAKVNARMKNGATSLLAAAVAGRIEALQLLLLQGADLKARYRDEATVLVMAATQGHANVVQLLLQKGASHQRTHSQRRHPSAGGCNRRTRRGSGVAAGRRRRSERPRCARCHASDWRGRQWADGSAVRFGGCRGGYRSGQQIGAHGPGGGSVGQSRRSLGSA